MWCPGRCRARASPTWPGPDRTCGWSTTSGRWWLRCLSTPSPWSPARKQPRSGQYMRQLAASSGVGMVNVFADKVFGGWTLDAAPKGVDKWSGVEAYCRYRGLDPGAVLAIGDGDNDVDCSTCRPCMRHEPRHGQSEGRVPCHLLRWHGRLGPAPPLPLTVVRRARAHSAPCSISMRRARLTA